MPLVAPPRPSFKAKFHEGSGVPTGTEPKGYSDVAERDSSPKLPGIRLFDLTGRVALITGGTKGLGAAMAAGLASAGAAVAVCGRSTEEAQSVAQQLAADYNVATLGLAADVTQTADIENLIRQIEATFGRLDILINNAGINIRGPIETLTLDEFRKVQQVNVDAVWEVTRAALPLLRQSPAGRIVNMASTLGIVGLANRTPYASSKGAIVQMTRALGLELADTPIRVNAICPGPFLTPMNVPIADTEEAKKFIVGAVALGRWGDLAEIQGAAIYLASDASSFTTGSLMVVDGGWTAR